jgi:hypothetical protein
MSKYVCYYSARKIFYRELAERWSKWAATAKLTETESQGISKFFWSLARRFGLIGEFREMGII